MARHFPIHYWLLSAIYNDLTIKYNNQNKHIMKKPYYVLLKRSETSDTQQQISLSVGRSRGYG
jgi:hypothetical protein